MKSTRSPTEFDQNNRDVTSTSGYVIKKNGSRGVKHRPSERQKMYHQARQMLNNEKRNTDAIQRYFHDGMAKKITESHLSATRWKEHHIMLNDGIAVEKHIYTATRAGFKIRGIGFSR